MKNSVKSYKKHLFIQLPSNVNVQQWPGNIEEWKPLEFLCKLENFDMLKVSLCSEFVDAEAQVSTCQSDEERLDLDKVTAVDLWVLPVGKILRQVLLKDIEASVKILLSMNETISSQSNSSVEGMEMKRLVMVCAHTRRDKRCGVIGQLVLEEMQKKVQKLNLKDKIGLYRTSHLGGHKFAGTMVVYPQGVWYGRVKPCHAEQIIEETCLEGKIIEELFRGREIYKEMETRLSW